MLWIGLTGGLASGKSTVGAMLTNRAIPVVNADQLAREAVKPGSIALSQISKAFGTEVLNADLSLDRKKLASKVFGQKASLEKLENILHPVIRKLAAESREQLKAQKNALAFYDVPLLFEKNMQSLFDKTVLVTTSEENQVRRAILRDKATRESIESRMIHQIPLTQKIILADYVIENNSSLIELEARVDEMLKAITIPKNIRSSK